MMNYTPILKRKYLWKTILLLSFLCSGRFSTSFDPKVQFSLFTLQTILLLGFKSCRGFKVTGEKLNRNHVPTASEYILLWCF